MKQKGVLSNRFQPFLRWAGSKRQLLSELALFWDDNCVRYIEPFAGSACLFFSLAPRKALLSDINTELIAMYQQISSSVSSVLEELERLKKSRNDYYYIRSLNPNELAPNQRAARFIYLNRYCFNGLYRTNSNGQFNVPYCGDDKGVMPPRKSFIVASELLKRAKLSANSFEDTLKKAKKGDFVYMDPPFSVKSKEIFNKYDKSKFGMENILSLKEWMHTLDRKGVRFVVSYAESEEADMLKEGFSYKTVSVRRSIAGFINKRKIVSEVMIFNKPSI